MAPAMISVGGRVIAMALCESRLRWRASGSFRACWRHCRKNENAISLENLHLSGYLELGMFDDAALALE
jgi:hypothetical protein